LRHVSQAEAKEIVHQGPVWSDARLDFDAAHEAVIEVARRL